MTAPRYTGEVTDDGGIHEWGEFRYAMYGGSGYSNKWRIIKRLAGEWPTDAQLITLADGDDPDHPSHFGGRVDALHNDTKHVTVYVD